MCDGCQKNILLINVIECTHYMFNPFSKTNKLQIKCLVDITEILLELFLSFKTFIDDL